MRETKRERDVVRTDPVEPHVVAKAAPVIHRFVDHVPLRDAPSVATDDGGDVIAQDGDQALPAEVSAQQPVGVLAVPRERVTVDHHVVAPGKGDDDVRGAEVIHVRLWVHDRPLQLVLRRQGVVLMTEHIGEVVILLERSRSHRGPECQPVARGQAAERRGQLFGLAGRVRGNGRQRSQPHRYQTQDGSTPSHRASAR